MREKLIQQFTSQDAMSEVRSEVNCKSMRAGETVSEMAVYLVPRLDKLNMDKESKVHAFINSLVPYLKYYCLHNIDKCDNIRNAVTLAKRCEGVCGMEQNDKSGDSLKYEAR